MVHGQSRLAVYRPVENHHSGLDVDHHRPADDVVAYDVAPYDAATDDDATAYDDVTAWLCHGTAYDASGTPTHYHHQKQPWDACIILEDPNAHNLPQLQKEYSHHHKPGMLGKTVAHLRGAVLCVLARCLRAILSSRLL